MKHSEDISHLAKAVITVMKEVEPIDKSMTVGTGNFKYQGVPDNQVKKSIGESMQKNGLCLVPTGVDPTVRIERWEEGGRMKQSVFTEAVTTYLLMHESGQWCQLQGYGHGVDTQDKGAGKATTYALKYALLYSFLVPTGLIDDSDATHSNDSPTPNVPSEAQKPWLNPDTNTWTQAVDYLKNKNGNIEGIEVNFRLSKANREKLLSEAI